jgi:hypothetical protein
MSRKIHKFEVEEIAAIPVNELLLSPSICAKTLETNFTKN